MNSYIQFVRLGTSFGLICCASLLGCGSDAGSGPPGAGSHDDGSTKAGFTKCGAVECQPGQFCYNILCQTGCQSNVNCAADQTCSDIDGTTHVGTCQNTAPPPPTKDCAAFCEKSKVCNVPNIEICPQLCEAASSECVACVIDSNCGQGCESLCGG